MGLRANGYIVGEHSVTCDICGFRFRRSKATLNWKRQMVCIANCYEPRHPNENVKPRMDITHVKDARPPGEDIFLEYGDVTVDDL